MELSSIYFFSKFKWRWCTAAVEDKEIHRCSLAKLKFSIPEQNEHNVIASFLCCNFIHRYYVGTWEFGNSYNIRYNSYNIKNSGTNVKL